MSKNTMFIIIIKKQNVISENGLFFMLKVAQQANRATT